MYNHKKFVLFNHQRSHADTLQGSKILIKPTALDYCNNVFSLDGCSTKCAKAVHHLSETDIWITHQRFDALGSFQQRQWTLNYLHSNSSLEEKETIFKVAGKGVCLPVWLATLGLSRTRYYEVRKAFASGVMSFEKILSPTTGRRPKSCRAVAWMQHYFEQVGDQMPNRMAIHLPSFLNTTIIYSRMKEELEERGEEVVCDTQFSRLWKEEFPQVSIPKVTVINVYRIYMSYILSDIHRKTGLLSVTPAH